MPSYTRQIAEFSANLRLSDVPKDVIVRAKWIILDGLSCALYGSHTKWVEILTGVVKRLDANGGPASIWGRDETVSAVNAVLVNGTMVHSYELDDGHSRAAIHSCAVVLPAAFAAAEYVGADKISGEKLLLAIIAGFEIGPRVGRCMNGEQTVKQGWHAPAIVSSFPAAITAGVILGLNSDQVFHALGIAGTQACGLMAGQFGSMMKRVQPAKNAQSGLYAALLAADGFTGIENVFEQEYGGFCSTFTNSTDRYDLAALTRDLGTSWETMGIATKIYACGAGNQCPVNAIEELVNETGLKVEDVEEITVGVTEAGIVHHWWSPYVPKGLQGAQMHLGFCVAMQLIEGGVFVDQWVEENVSRPDLVEFANRVKVVRNIEREQKSAAYRKGADVTVKLKNGKMLNKTVDFRPGTERRPLTDAQRTAKFRRLTNKVRSEQVAEIEKIVWDLERMATITPLIQIL